jgi:hypothetical protein
MCVVHDHRQTVAVGRTRGVLSRSIDECIIGYDRVASPAAQLVRSPGLPTSASERGQASSLLTGRHDHALHTVPCLLQSPPTGWPRADCTLRLRRDSTATLLDTPGRLPAPGGPSSATTNPLQMVGGRDSAPGWDPASRRDDAWLLLRQLRQRSLPAAMRCVGCGRRYAEPLPVVRVDASAWRL